MSFASHLRSHYVETLDADIEVPMRWGRDGEWFMAWMNRPTAAIFVGSCRRVRNAWGALLDVHHIDLYFATAEFEQWPRIWLTLEVPSAPVKSIGQVIYELEASCSIQP